MWGLRPRFYSGVDAGIGADNQVLHLVKDFNDRKDFSDEAKETLRQRLRQRVNQMVQEGILSSDMRGYYDHFDPLIESNNDTISYGNYQTGVMVPGDYTEVRRRIAREHQRIHDMEYNPSMHVNQANTIIDLLNREFSTTNPLTPIEQQTLQAIYNRRANGQTPAEGSLDLAGNRYYGNPAWINTLLNDYDQHSASQIESIAGSTLDERIAWMQAQYRLHPEYHNDPRMHGSHNVNRIIRVMTANQTGNFPLMTDPSIRTHQAEVMQAIEADPEYQRLFASNDKAGINNRIRQLIQNGQEVGNNYEAIVQGNNMYPQINADGTWEMLHWNDNRLTFPHVNSNQPIQANHHANQQPRQQSEQENAAMASGDTPYIPDGPFADSNIDLADIDE